MQPQKPVAPVAAKKSAAGSSKTGAILSVLALIFAAIANALINARYKPTVNGSAEKVDAAISGGILHILAVLLSVPMLIAAFALAALAIVLTIIKLRKVKATGWFTSAIWILLSIWALKIAAGAFELIKAK